MRFIRLWWSSICKVKSTTGWQLVYREVKAREVFGVAQWSELHLECGISLYAFSKSLMKGHVDDSYHCFVDQLHDRRLITSFSARLLREITISLICDPRLWDTLSRVEMFGSDDPRSTPWIGTRRKPDEIGLNINMGYWKWGLSRSKVLGRNMPVICSLF